MNALILLTSDLVIASSSAISTIRTPCTCIDESFDPRSAISSVNQGSASTLNAVDFIKPCGPSRTKQVSILHPGQKTLATAPINHFDPAALM